MPLGTLFEDAVIIMFDGIIPVLMERMGVTEEDMRKRHAIWV
jgi:6-phospho-3-hexuloisomerase